MGLAAHLVVVTVMLCLQLTSSLSCLSCNGLCDCLHPTVTECSAHTQCYTVKRLNDGKITRKGCTQECNLVNDFDGMCTLCRGLSCNTETNLTPMNGAYNECNYEHQDLGQELNPAVLRLGQGQSGTVVQQQGANQIGSPNQVQPSHGIQHGQTFSTQQQDGLGSQGVYHFNGLNQVTGYAGNKNYAGPSSNSNQPNYQPAPSVGSSQLERQRLNTDNNGLSQESKNNLGQEIRNCACCLSYSLAALNVILLGLQRL